MFNYFYKVKDYLMGLVTKSTNYFTKIEEGFVIAPCVGDIIEDENGFRKIVLHVSVDNNGMFDLRTSQGFYKCVDKKGRSKVSLSLSRQQDYWPPINSIVIRDGRKIYPISEFRLSIYQMIDKMLK